MTAIIDSIKATQKRIEDLIKGAKSIRPTNDDEKQQLEKCEEMAQKLQMYIEMIEAHNDKWLQYVSKLPKKQREEEIRYQEATQGDRGTTILNEAREEVIELTMLAKQIKKWRASRADKRSREVDRNTNTGDGHILKLPSTTINIIDV